MGLTCDRDGDAEPGMRLWYGPTDFTKLATKRNRKCCSCGEQINIGDACAEARRFKIPDSDVERRIYGDEGEIPLASAFMCEECAGLFFSLEDLGFCVQPWEDQRELVKEYADLHRQPQRQRAAADSAPR